MRRIQTSAQLTALAILAISLAIAVWATRMLFGVVDGGPFRGVGMLATGAAIYVACVILILRVFLRFFPVQVGELAAGSRAEWVYNVYQILFLTLLESLISSLG